MDNYSSDWKGSIRQKRKKRKEKQAFCPLVSPLNPLFDFLPSQVPTEAQMIPCVHSSVPWHTFPKQALSKTLLVVMAVLLAWVNNRVLRRGEELNLRGGGNSVCECVWRYSPQRRAALQSHSTLRKDSGSGLSNRNLHEHILNTHIHEHMDAVHLHMFYLNPT